MLVSEKGFSGRLCFLRYCLLLNVKRVCNRVKFLPAGILSSISLAHSATCWRSQCGASLCNQAIMLTAFPSLIFAAKKTATKTINYKAAAYGGAKFYTQVKLFIPLISTT